jgi:hypothetical protein
MPCCGLYQLIAPHLTEMQRRLLAGAAARALGRGGGARTAKISGLSRPDGVHRTRCWTSRLTLAAASAAPAMGPSGPLPGSLAAHWVATSTSSGGIGFPSMSAALI